MRKGEAEERISSHKTVNMFNRNSKKTLEEPECAQLIETRLHFQLHQALSRISPEGIHLLKRLAVALWHSNHLYNNELPSKAILL